MTIKCPECGTVNPSDSKYCKECAKPLPSAEDIEVTETMEAAREELTTGSTFADRYQIIEELGKGGMGRVYRVLDKKLKEEIALKLIKPEIASDKKTVERFSNELKIARKIGHKNVARMFDLNEEQGRHYITMEYVRGEDLKKLIRKIGQLSAGQAIPIAIQVCEGLSEAHRLGVVHRDLKPQNVMVDEGGDARIMDFGIARSLESKGITGAGVMVGTPEYMSPEQVEGKEAGQSSDIYSLGVILYEMVTGRVPFEGDTPFTIGVKHKSEMPKDPKELNAQIPEDLSSVIMKCLEKDKEKRYQSAGEVRSELENIQKGIPTTERVIPERKPFTSREITVTFGLKKLLIPALVVIALAVVAVVIWRLAPSRERIPIPQDKPSLAVMYFENNTGNESLDIWSSALSDLLISDLSQSKYIRVLPKDRLFGILSQLNLLDAKRYSSENLKDVAARGGASHILQGTLTKAGENFRINTTLQDSNTMEIIGSDMVEGKGEESFHSMVDELTRKVKTNFKLSAGEIASDLDKDVGKITTSSSEAYKYYSQGRDLHMNGDYRASITLMEKAIAIDPEFAMAYRSMSAAYPNLGYPAEGDKYLKKALELSERLSYRERYLIQGNYYYRSEIYDKSLESFKKLLQVYPDDINARGFLAWVYVQIEEWDKAIEQYEIVMDAGEQRMIPYVQFAGSYRQKGMYDKAREILESYLSNISENAQVHRHLSFVYEHQGKLDLAMAEIEKEYSLSLNIARYKRQKGDIFLYKGEFINAEKEYQDLLKHEETAANNIGMRGLSFLFLLQGKFEELISLLKRGVDLAIKEDQKSWEIWYHSALFYVYLMTKNPMEALKEISKAESIAVETESKSGQRNALYGKGLIYLEMGSIDEAQRAAIQLKEMIEKGMNKKLMRVYYHLVGMIELKRNNYPKSIEYFKDSLSLQQGGPLAKPAINIDSLGLAYYRAEDLEKAREEYEKIARLTIGRLNWGDIYAKSFYMLGKIYEQQGNSGKAIDHYEKFLDLWKDADPGLVEVEDAKKRLAGLKSLP